MEEVLDTGMKIYEIACLFLFFAYKLLCKQIVPLLADTWHLPKTNQNEWRK